MTFQGVALVEIFTAVLAGERFLLRVCASVSVQRARQRETLVANFAAVGTFACEKDKSGKKRLKRGWKKYSLLLSFS